MQSKILEGSASEITRAIEQLNGHIVRAVVYFDDPANETGPANDDWERDMDAIMATAPLNKQPADVSREAMYRPENQ
jgi:hypothetical protein